MTKNRKPLHLTFIMNEDPCKKGTMPELRRHAILTAMKEAVDAFQLTEYNIITRSSRNFRRDIMYKNIPDLWLHDARGTSEMGPFENYYVLDFDDESRIMFLLIPPEYDDMQMDPMIL